MMRLAALLLAFGLCHGQYSTTPAAATTGGYGTTAASAGTTGGEYGTTVGNAGTTIAGDYGSTPGNSGTTANDYGQGSTTPNNNYGSSGATTPRGYPQSSTPSATFRVSILYFCSAFLCIV